jgi:hypothetical protein
MHLLASAALIRLLARIIPLILIGLLAIQMALASIVLQKSTLTWPVAAPTRVAATSPGYAASGWTIASPFGWRPDLEEPGQWELHEGADLAGPMFCPGCAMPPLGDVAIARVGWDQEWGSDPLRDGAGVVVDMQLQHPEESGSILVRYGHLHPYHVYVRTRSCTQTVDCPTYHADGQASVSVTCPGRVILTGGSRAERAYVYATPGQCKASVAWPSDYLPQGATSVTFDQRIVPGAASSDAAITFNAQLPPPPPPLTPTLSLPPTP